MKIKKRLERAFVVSFLFLLLAAQALYAAAAPGAPKEIDKEIKKQESQLNQIQKQIKMYREKERQAKTQEKEVMKQIRGLSTQMSVAEQRLNITYLKRKRVLNSLVETNASINATSRDIDNAKGLLKERLVAIYKYGSIAEFNLLLSASGAQDALLTSYLLGKIAEQDKRLITDLSMKKAKLDSAKTSLAKQKVDLEDKNRQLEKEKVVIQKTTEDRNKLLDRVRKDKALFQAEQEELLRASKELQNTINRLLSEKRKLQKEQRGGQQTPVYYKGGRLAWPLGIGGEISSPYGTRVHPVFKTRTTHTGVDIRAPKGTPVLAAEAGEVLYTGWLRGYGQVVILDHGGNLTTVYAHLSGIDTQEGAKVSARSQVGRVGSTGVTTGNHLHFEVRVNGDTTNPMKYLQK